MTDGMIEARRRFHQEILRCLAEAGATGNRYGTAVTAACWGVAEEELRRRFDLLIEVKANPDHLLKNLDSAAMKELGEELLADLTEEKANIEALITGPSWVANPNADRPFQRRFQALVDAIPGRLKSLAEQAMPPCASRVLFVAADPYQGNRLRLDLEVRAVEEALRSSGLEDRFSLEQLWAATFLDLQHALLRHQPAVLHFSGHGTPSGELALERDSQVPSESRRPEPSDQRPAEALARMLGSIEGLKVRCVVLNACFSEVQAVEVARHVDCVVGLLAEVRDSAAIEFARGFYGALAWGQSVQAAFDLGVAQVKSRDDASLYRLIAPKTDPRTVKLLEPPG
jgi:hypothetical protein